ncbi:Peptidyl-prolyl cis-trans isomerase fkbp62, partial [Thalictrum thalictroides]
KYTARLVDGTIFEKIGFDGNEPLKFVVDEEKVVAGLDRAVATMRKGELAIVTVQPDYGYGSTEVRQELAAIPASSVVVYEVEMVDFTKEKSSWEMNSKEKIEVAVKKKEEGNLLFKCGKHQKAVKRYAKAVDYVAEDGFFGDDEQMLAKALRVSCWLNHAACSLKLNNYEEAVTLCSKVLAIDRHNIKGLYRRAQAFIETEELYLSELDIKKALEVDPHNREVRSLQNTLKQVQSKSNKRDAKLYANMFAPRRKFSSVVTKRPKVEKSENEEGSDCFAN